VAESRFWEGFLIGGLVGLAAGLLLAPQSGAESRRLVLEKGREVGREVADAAARGYRSAAERLSETARTLREAVSRGREVAVEVTSELSERAEQA